MAKIDYNNIADEIATIIRAALTDAVVEIEAEVQISADFTPWIGIYLDRRDTPENEQVLAAGRKTRYDVRFSIWLFHYSFDSVSQAAAFRNDAIETMEQALMGNRTLNDAVQTSWLEGGLMQSAKDEQDGGFIMGAETILLCKAQHTL